MILCGEDSVYFKGIVITDVLDLGMDTPIDDDVILIDDDVILVDDFAFILGVG